MKFVDPTQLATASAPGTHDAGTTVDVAPQHDARLERRIMFGDRTNPMLWLFFGLLTVGAWQFATLHLIPNTIAYPQAVIGSLVVWSVYGYLWLRFIRHRELFAPLSDRTTVICVLWGALIATNVIAMAGDTAVLSLLGKWGSPELASSWGAGLTAPIVEEPAKLLGVFVIIFLLRDRFRSPFETMIVGGFVGLGFQIVEDYVYSIGQAVATFGQLQVLDVFQIFVQRGLIGFFTHMIWTAIAGAGIGFIVLPGRHRNVRLGAVMIAWAFVLHGLWDSPLLADLGLLAVVVKAVPGLLVLRWAYRHAVACEQAWVLDALAPEYADGTIDADDLDLLSTSYRRRHRHLREVRKHAGAPVADAERRYQRSLLLLADAIADQEDTGSIDRYRDEMRAARASLRQLSLPAR